RGLLQPGFHSGTVPRLYARLRVAEKRAFKTRDWNNARWYRRELEHVAAALWRFVDRELIGLLRQSASWQGQRLAVGLCHLAVHRSRFERIHDAFPARPVEVELVYRQGWLIAGITEPGWLAEITPDQWRAFTTALASLYKRAGIDLVREQVRANLPEGVTA